MTVSPSRSDAAGFKLHGAVRKGPLDALPHPVRDSGVFARPPPQGSDRTDRQRTARGRSRDRSGRWIPAFAGM